MSVSMEEIKHVQEVIWRTLKFEDRREIEMIPYSGAYVKIEKDRTTVGGSTLSEYARGVHPVRAQYHRGERRL